jgi:hypothetical protein
VEKDVDENPTVVEWIFRSDSPECRDVSVINSRFSGYGDRIIEQVMVSVAGFGLVLAELKAYIEYGNKLNLVEGRFHDQLMDYSKLTK